jgi:prepilin peptidase CpaA
VALILKGSMEPITKIWTLALTVGLTAGWIDYRTRRIPNWLTVPGALSGIVMHWYGTGPHGVHMALEGMVLALTCLLPLVLLRAMGAGDWKLMGAFGAILGPVMMLMVLATAIFLSGIMAMVMVVRAGRVKETLMNVFVLVQGFLSFGLRDLPDISLDNPDLMKLPFGVAAALAAVLCFVATRWKW